jgi:hypothetical protein
LAVKNASKDPISLQGNADTVDGAAHNAPMILTAKNATKDMYTSMTTAVNAKITIAKHAIQIFLASNASKVITLRIRNAWIVDKHAKSVKPQQLAQNASNNLGYFSKIALFVILISLWTRDAILQP